MASATPGPMTARRWRPCVPLLRFVEAFGVREIDGRVKKAYVPLPARRDCFLEFYLKGRYRIVSVATGAEHWAPRCVLVGPSTSRREDLKLAGPLQVFSIRFSPTGFHALFGIPARLLRDQAIEAEAVLGHEIVELHDQLAAVEPPCWGSIAERYLMGRLRSLSPAADIRPVTQAAALLQQSRGTMTVAQAAGHVAISPRHLERLFQEQVGVAPKVFGRLLRLDHALHLAGSRNSWADIACRCGYTDQSHLLRDFRALTGLTPAQFVALRSAPPLL